MLFWFTSSSKLPYYYMLWKLAQEDFQRMGYNFLFLYTTVLSENLCTKSLTSQIETVYLDYWICSQDKYKIYILFLVMWRKRMLRSMTQLSFVESCFTILSVSSPLELGTYNSSAMIQSIQNCFVHLCRFSPLQLWPRKQSKSKKERKS